MKGNVTVFWVLGMAAVADNVEAAPLSYRTRPIPNAPFFSSTNASNKNKKNNKNKTEKQHERQTLKQHVQLVSTRMKQALPTNKNKDSGELGSTGFFYGIGEDLLRSTLSTPEERETSRKEECSSDAISGNDSGGPSTDNIRADGSNPKYELQEDTTTAATPANINTRSVSPYMTSEIDTDMAVFRDVMCETMEEFRKTADDLKDNVNSLRKEIAEWNRIQRSVLRQRNGVVIEDDDEFEEGDSKKKRTSKASSSEKVAWRMNRRKHFDDLAESIEKWAYKLLFEEQGEEHGWKEVHCHKFFRNKYNAEGKNRCFIKWMPDSRGEESVAEEDKGKEFPCMKCYGVIDAPMEDVCTYLADESNVGEYNDLVENFRDLEEISPRSKICWGKCPQVLLLKPRDFVTFCCHRWRHDGTQVVVNQAVDHEDAPSGIEVGAGTCRARALRGANFISRDPEDPNKTRYTFLAHADPGGDLAAWACRKAVNSVAPIEPFKYFYKLEQAVHRAAQQPRAEFVSARFCSHGRPAGLSQLGYACFWKSTCDDHLDYGGDEEEKVD